MAQVMTADRNLKLETEAAKKLMESLREQSVADDADLVADSLEGETGLIEALEAALCEIDECEVLVTGLDEKIKAFDARRKQQSDRADRIRALIEMAMIATEQKSLKLTTATITISKRKPSLVITNEADIPARFWVAQERPAPKLDKKALAEALAGKEEITGASLDNGTVSLTVRRR